MGFYTWLDMRTGRWAPLFKVAAPLGAVGFGVYAWASAAARVGRVTGTVTGPTGGQVVGGILMGLAVVLALAGFIGLVATGPNRD